MELKSLVLKNFRSYSDLSLSFSSGLNVFVGANAQGKTNILEAIYFLAIGKSVRATRERDAIKWGEVAAKISLLNQKKYTKQKLEMTLSRSNKKIITLSNIPIKRMGQLFGEFNAVYFSPDELKLVKDSPEDRRKFMDISLSQMSKGYFYLLGKYEKILANRNKLLKTSVSQTSLKDALSIWDEQLAEVGSKIVFQRIEFLKNLAPFAALTQSYLTDGAEELTMEYCGIFAETENEICEKFKKQLTANFEKDARLGFTSVGPHRDDIKVWINKADVRLFGSQGQQRTVALALKLSELEILEQHTGEKPILLLDDVLSELDATRRKKLINFCKKTQTFLTCTEFEFDGKQAKTFLVKNGSAEEI